MSSNLSFKRYVLYLIAILSVLFTFNTSIAAESSSSDKTALNRITDWSCWNQYFDKSINIEGKQGGYALIVLKNGKRVIERAEGWARAPWERETPAVKMTIYTPVFLASVCKPITAVCFLKAWELEKKKFSLDDPFWHYSKKIQTIFPLASEEVKKITFRQILTHRTGLCNKEGADPRSIRNTIHIKLAKPLLFEPGTKYNYNNINFYLLRILTEEISGMGFIPFLEKYINKPLGIKTLGGTNPNPQTLHYSPNNQNLPGLTLQDSSHGNNNWRFGAAGGFGSADDLARFMVGLRRYKILSKKTTDQMFEEELGWASIPNCPGGKYYRHHGFWTWNDRKAMAAVERFPHGIDVVVVSNSDLGILDSFLHNAYKYAYNHIETVFHGKLKDPELIYFRKDGLVTGSYLNGNGKPIYGYLEKSRNVEPAKDRFGNPRKAVRFKGNGMLRYRVPYFPEREYTFMAWVCPEGLPANHFAQIFSAWCRDADDPLRVFVHGEKLYARIEAGVLVGTEGVNIKSGEWIHIAATKKQKILTLYINGKPLHIADVPDKKFTLVEDFALGANPHITTEHLTGRIDDFALYAKALSDEEINRIYKEGLKLELPEEKEQTKKDANDF